MLPKDQYLEMQSLLYDSLVNTTSPKEPPQIEIDLSRLETEAGWTAILDRFYLKATPVWFDWLKWVMMVAALMVVAKKSGNHVAQVITGCSFVLIFYYLGAFFFRIRLKGLHFISSRKRAHLLSLAISVSLTLGAYLCAVSLATAVSEMSK